MGPLELLVLQPTPFCNLDCAYCYLPQRQSTQRITTTTLEAIYRWVFASGLVRAPFTLLWHAGEPLVLPVSFYEDALDRFERHKRSDLMVSHSFQTNATLLDQEWCDFIRRRGLFPGISVDGPAFLHDQQRRTRGGQGTLERVLQGIHLLNANGIDFHVITVLTRRSLDYPDELFDFYRAHGIRNVGFNIEELEGVHGTSSLAAAEARAAFRSFLDRFLELALRGPEPLRVREWDTALGLLLNREGTLEMAQENTPWAIVNVDCAGNFSTFSPELLGLRGEPYGEFVLGNVLRDSLEDVLASPHYQRILGDIERGRERCRAECRYFGHCGGGPPANKFFETGSFASTETLFCRLHIQDMLTVGLSRLERVGPPQPLTGCAHEN